MDGPGGAAAARPRARLANATEGTAHPQRPRRVIRLVGASARPGASNYTSGACRGPGARLTCSRTVKAAGARFSLPAPGRRRPAVRHGHTHGNNHIPEAAGVHRARPGFLLEALTHFSLPIHVPDPAFLEFSSPLSKSCSELRSAEGAPARPLGGVSVPK